MAVGRLGCGGGTIVKVAMVMAHMSNWLVAGRRGGEKGHLFVVVGAWVDADSGDFGFGHGGFRSVGHA